MPSITREGDGYFVEPAAAPRSKAAHAADGWPSPHRAEPTYARGAHTLATNAAQATRFQKPTLEHISGPGRYEQRNEFGVDHGSFSFDHARRDFSLASSSISGASASPGPTEYVPDRGLIAKHASDAREEVDACAGKKYFGGTQRFRDQFVQDLLEDLPPPRIEPPAEPRARTVKCTFGTAPRPTYLEALQVAGHAPVDTPAPGDYTPSATVLELVAQPHSFNIRCGHTCPVPGGKGLAANPLKLLDDYEKDTRAAVAQTKKERRRTLVSMQKEGTLLFLPDAKNLHRLYSGFRKAPDAEVFAPEPAHSYAKRNKFGVRTGRAAQPAATKPAEVRALLAKANKSRALPPELARAHATVVANSGGDGGALLDHFFESGNYAVGARHPTPKEPVTRKVLLKLGGGTRELVVRSAGTIPAPSMSQSARVSPAKAATAAG